MSCQYAETVDGKQACPCCGTPSVFLCSDCENHEPYDCGCSPCSFIEGCEIHDKSMQGCTCDGCFRKFKVDIIVSDSIWEKIRPDKTAPLGAGLLCGPCILSRIEGMGQYNAFELLKI